METAKIGCLARAVDLRLVLKYRPEDSRVGLDFYQNLRVDGRPLVALIQHLSHGLLGALEGVVRAPAALLLIGGGNFGGSEDVLEGDLENVHELLGAEIQGDGVEAGLTAHGREINEAVGVVAHVLGRHVLNGMHRGHLQVLLVGLAEADVELAQDIAAGERLFVGNANKGGGDLRVVEVEGLYIHAFFHAFECSSLRSNSRSSFMSMRNTVTFLIGITAGRTVYSCVSWHS